MRPQTRYMFIAACAGMFLFGVTMVSLGSILPEIITKYNLTEIAAGTLTSLLPAGILSGSILFGPITDRYGYKYLLISSTLFIIAALEGLAFTQNYFLLRWYIILIGFAGGMLNGRDPVLIMMGLFLFFQSGLEGVTTNWTTTYFQSMDMERREAALFALSGYILSLTIARIFSWMDPEKISLQSYPVYQHLCIGNRDIHVNVFKRICTLCCRAFHDGSGVCIGIPCFAWICRRGVSETVRNSIQFCACDRPDRQYLS